MSTPEPTSNIVQADLKKRGISLDFVGYQTKALPGDFIPGTLTSEYIRSKNRHDMKMH